MLRTISTALIPFFHRCFVFGTIHFFLIYLYILDELGHAFGMYHSGDAGDALEECIKSGLEKEWDPSSAIIICDNYSDGTCSMGADVGRKMNGELVCYNPAKKWQTGWYDNECIDISGKVCDEYPFGTFCDDLYGVVRWLSDRLVYRLSAPDSSDRDFYLARSDVEPYCDGATLTWLVKDDPHLPDYDVPETSLSWRTVTKCLKENAPFDIPGLGYSIKVINDTRRTNFVDPPKVCLYQTDLPSYYSDPCNCRNNKYCIDLTYPPPRELCDDDYCDWVPGVVRYLPKHSGLSYRLSNPNSSDLDFYLVPSEDESDCAAGVYLSWFVKDMVSLSWRIETKCLKWSEGSFPMLDTGYSIRVTGLWEGDLPKVCIFRTDWQDMPGSKGIDPCECDFAEGNRYTSQKSCCEKNHKIVEGRCVWYDPCPVGLTGGSSGPSPRPDRDGERLTRDYFNYKCNTCCTDYGCDPSTSFPSFPCQEFTDENEDGNDSQAQIWANNACNDRNREGPGRYEIYRADHVIENCCHGILECFSN